MNFPKYLALEGESVSLLPLEYSQAEILFENVQQGGLNTSTVLSLPQTLEEMRFYISTALDARAHGTGFPFVIVEKQWNAVIGTTRFANFVPDDSRVEIGWTWLNVKFHRTFANTEMKYLMLSYAFEQLSLNRVEFKANALNDVSRRAMERIGAEYEGVLRQHMKLTNGVVRDTVYYSILADEWASVKERLEATMKSHSSSK
jgi:N-acetyltransferase